MRIHPIFYISHISTSDMNHPSGSSPPARLIDHGPEFTVCCLLDILPSQTGLAVFGRLGGLWTWREIVGPSGFYIGPWPNRPILINCWDLWVICCFWWLLLFFPEAMLSVAEDSTHLPDCLLLIRLGMLSSRCEFICFPAVLFSQTLFVKCSVKTSNNVFFFFTSSKGISWNYLHSSFLPGWTESKQPDLHKEHSACLMPLTCLKATLHCRRIYLRSTAILSLQR